MHIIARGGYASGRREGWRRVKHTQSREDWRCPNCGARNRYYWIKCPACGHPREDS